MSVTFANAAELVQRLGNVPLDRICFTPLPGTATERDLLAAMHGSDRLYELVDGTLVEETMGVSESIIAGLILRKIGNFAEEHDLGISAGADGTVRLLKGLVRVPDVSFFCWDKLPGRVLPSRPIPALFPDLAVEVLSENNTSEEMERKLGEYFSVGGSQPNPWRSWPKDGRFSTAKRLRPKAQGSRSEPWVCGPIRRVPRSGWGNYAAPRT